MLQRTVSILASNITLLAAWVIQVF
uniref:Uncharacterized protein n=1 Tax=Arundo donax TaxID=35708 RepID=A0A0A8Z363_ARUDO